MARAPVLVRKWRNVRPEDLRNLRRSAVPRSGLPLSPSRRRGPRMDGVDPIRQALERAIMPVKRRAVGGPKRSMDGPLTGDRVPAPRAWVDPGSHKEEMNAHSG